jgi:hypothetical protein
MVEESVWTCGRQPDLEGDGWLPYDLRDGIALNESSFYVLEMDWSTEGAREFPFGVVLVDGEEIDHVTSSSNVFYVGGSLKEQVVAFGTSFIEHAWVRCRPLSNSSPG